MQANAIQDFYPDDFSHCFGCGKLNAAGHRIKTRWEGDETVTHFTPEPEHIALPGFVYGGLVASLIDCHAMATAAGYAVRAAGHAVGEIPSPRYVTAALNVSYLRPTPLGPVIEVRARVREATPRKTVVDVTVAVEGVKTATGEVVAVPMPETMLRKPAE
ncbi:MAG TPA: PaaI family thioesterase [Candidatus Krumholzibacteria bacterium]|nr:PaaI family thioesterase [Candidatus Krumholzibacteria bacterium]